VLGKVERDATIVSFADLGDAADRVAVTLEPEPAPAPPGEVFELRVTLDEIEPPVWRRVLVDASSTLAEVHEVIQAAFGWWDYHLHEFTIGRTRYGVPDPDDDWGLPLKDERKVPIGKVAGMGTRIGYLYDFGDSWHHTIAVDGIWPGARAEKVPACIGGARACPPEDCGGVGGYEELRCALADPTDSEHESLKEWIGRPFDPEAFDPAAFETNLRQAATERPRLD
jgi:hypothetical protein